MDDWELDEAIQSEVRANWDKVTEENLDTLTDFAGYRQAFLELHGFGFDEIDYEADVDPAVAMALEND